MIGGIRDEEVFLIALTIVTVAAVLGGIVILIYKSRGRRLRVLEQALQRAIVISKLTRCGTRDLFMPGILGD